MNNGLNRFLLLAVAAAVSTTQADEQASQPEKNWRELAQAAGLMTQDVARLDQDGILVSNEAYKQVFTPYLGGHLPLFITSDSLLNAYHVLYEESILRLERKQAAKLPEILRFVLKGLDTADKPLTGNPILTANAKRRAQLVLGIALRLSDEKSPLTETNLNQIVEQEAASIVAATGLRKPAWLGKPDPGFMALDYSRYKPRGFYTQAEPLKRYFRTVAWLQSVPFRVKEDEELLAILMLGSGLSFDKREEYKAFFGGYRMFIGTGDDWDLLEAAWQAQNLSMDLHRGDLQQKRAWLRTIAGAQGPGPAINDQIRFMPEKPDEVAEPNFRIISAYRTPSALLFQRTTDTRRLHRDFPEGLEMCVALGSPLARNLLPDKDKAVLLAAIDQTKLLFNGQSLYCSYLHALSALLDKPEPDAPAFMKGDAWQRKSCNAVLGGWAQLMHTWSLQAKQSVNYLCLTRTPTGFVEPEPEFFARMADVAEQTSDVLTQAGVFEPDYSFVVEKLKKFMAIMAVVNTEDEFEKRVRTVSRDESDDLDMPYMLMLSLSTDPEYGGAKNFAEKKHSLERLLADLEKGALKFSPSVRQTIQAYDFDLRSLWEKLAKVCRRLETISHKQLRGVALSENEAAFIKSYGERIAEIMLYGGNSYVTPRDDAPRIVDVFTNPNSTPSYLQAGIGRPQKLYVLYPWQGQRLLCVGAVLPYHEFRSAERLTDVEWRTLLTTDGAPAAPEWMKPIMSGNGLRRPVLEK